ncbi:MAG: hypothetical protein OIN66_03430 [Candidatus Methanoperedens sp.]|nr:hypothetical protein [Candidatus Methanoperedens sp.]
MNRSKGMKLSGLLLAVMLASAVFMPIATASTSLNVAEKLALQYSEDIWGKDNTDIIDSKLYYGLDNDPAVYVFTIQKKETSTINKEYSGTTEQQNYGAVVIGATKSLSEKSSCPVSNPCACEM